MNSRRLLRDPRRGSRNAFTAGNGHHPGVTSGHGNSRETGGSGGCLAPSGGAWCRGSQATGLSGAARPDKAPFISYMKGALLYSARPRSSRPGATRRPQRQHLRQIMKPNDPGSTTSTAASPAARSGRHDQHFPADGDRAQRGRHPHQEPDELRNASESVEFLPVPRSSAHPPEDATDAGQQQKPGEGVSGDDLNSCRGVPANDKHQADRQRHRDHAVGPAEPEREEHEEEKRHPQHVHDMPRLD